MSSRRTRLALIALLAAGCLPQPRLKDNSQLVNGGVDIVPGPVLAAEKMKPSTAPAVPAGRDLVQIIERSDQKHYHLIEVLRESGLVPKLQEAGPYTVLAPNDAAFDKLPPGVLDDLLKPANHDKLVRFVSYHILRGRVSFADMLDTNGQVQTLAGGPMAPKRGANSPSRPMGTAVIIKGTDGKVTVNDANVVRTDTAAQNGTVHWIDNVLFPPAPLDNRGLGVGSEDN